MKIESEESRYTLDAKSIDEMAERIESFLKRIGTERSNVIRVKLTFEEALLRWRDHFGEDSEVGLFTGVSFRHPLIRISLTDDPYDPLTNSENAFGYWADSLMDSVSLNPLYSYTNNDNIVSIKLPRPEQNPAKALLLAAVTGIVAGISARLIFPEEQLIGVTEEYFRPVLDALFRILNVAAIPIIFLTVLAAVCGAGTVAERGKNNRKIIARFILLTVILTITGCVISMAAYGIRTEIAAPQGSRLITVFNAVLSVIPTDIMTPFQAGNSPQLIFLAVILGNAILIAGHQAENLVKIVDECNKVILLIADWVSRVTPFFVALLVIFGMWSKGTQERLAAMWKPVACFAGMTAVMLLVFTIILSYVKKVDVRTVINKVKKPFITAFRNSSVNASYGETYNSCVKKLGISSRLVDYALPLGLVLYQPVATIGLVTFTLFAAKLYGVETPIMWICTLVALSIALEAASPPVSGVDLLAYAALFSKMGIPAEALVLAMIADILFCFISSAADQTMLQYELVMEAGNMGMLNTKKLRK